MEEKAAVTECGPTGPSGSAIGHGVEPRPEAGTSLPPTGTMVPRRVVVAGLWPAVDDGRFPIKRTVGERVDAVSCVFADGHDVLTVVLRDRHLTPRAAEGHDGTTSSPSRASSTAVEGWHETPMTPIAEGTDRWGAAFDLQTIGWHEYQVVAWVDRFRTWRRDLKLKAQAGHDVAVELLEGTLMLRAAAARAAGGDAAGLLRYAEALSGPLPAAERVVTALDTELDRLMAVYADRSNATMSDVRRVWVDRERGRFSTWYEMFPRSAGPDPDRSGTFGEAATLLAGIADLGFDVVYLPPIHPIGTRFRKGRNNALVAAPGDPGSPWAIGSEAGGHTAIDPALGSFEEFHAFRQEAERLGLEVALDLAWQCSPDHPWVDEHPEWFRHRPDGTIKYAENPPKRYQDIYPLDFEGDAWQSLWRALLDVGLFWAGHGVRIFRVDNPHTKPFAFWEWFIDGIHERYPDVIFLSEAFTRPAPMQYLAKAGFTQSYTYFTWRNSKAELTDYFTELTATEVREYLRPNLFTNTPDILHQYLQQGGRPAFEARLLLAATLGASYGIYSGFELCEGCAVPGTEEYADSEKYQFRKWDRDRPGNINELIARVNTVRRGHRALQSDWSLRFHDTDNPEIIAYTKHAGDEWLLMVVNLDPRHLQHGHVRVPPDALRALGVPADAVYKVRDLIDDTPYEWRGEWNYVRFEPDVRQGHILVFEVGG